MELGKKIKQLRLKTGLTQEQLAEKLGIGAQSVSKWENAVAMPDISALPLLAEIFGVSIDDLFDLTVEQRLNRIESRMDVEDEPRSVVITFIDRGAPFDPLFIGIGVNFVIMCAGLAMGGRSEDAR
jgi:transcriptional regulator with XRE-family HTH domain